MKGKKNKFVHPLLTSPREARLAPFAILPRPIMSGPHPHPSPLPHPETMYKVIIMRRNSS
jgi:hypothetical protein